MPGGSLFAPDFKETPYWWDAAPLRPAAGLPLPESTDVVVIGGGYAGLSAALELSRAGASATVLEAEQLGHGASTRNGGSITFGNNVGKHHLVPGQAPGTDLQAELARESVDAYEHFEGVIARERIDCYTGRVGRYVGAHSPASLRALERQAPQIERSTGAETVILPRARQHEELVTPYYHGGLLTRDGGGVQPAAYHRGLLAACDREGVALRDRARVQRIAGRPGAFTVATTRGVVTARDVVIATNGYTDRLSPWHRRRLIPVDSHMIATRPVGEAALRAVMPGLRVYGDTKRVPYYFRPSPDHTRLLFGGRASFGKLDLRQAAERLYRCMIGVFPQLEGVALTHAWRGAVAFTFDHLPHAGQRDGIHYCLGCNGSGVAMMSYLGHRVAERILGRANHRSVLETLPFPSHPLYGGDPWFLPAAGGYYRFRDWADRSVAALRPS